MSVALGSIPLDGQTINFDHVPRKEFEIHLDRLAPGDPQMRKVIEAFYDDYLSDLARLDESMSQIGRWSGRFRDEGIELVMLPEWSREFHRHSGNVSSLARDGAQELQDDYFDSLRSTLPNRIDDVAAMERMRTRQKYLTVTRIVYTRTTPDLIMLVHDLDPGATRDADIAAALHAYDRDMHALLEEFERCFAERREGLTAARDRGDLEELRRIFEDDLIVKMRMRRLNERTARLLRPLLDASVSSRFSDAFDAGRYPDLHPGFTNSTINHLLTQPGLSADDRERLESIQTEIAEARDDLASELRYRFDAMYTPDAIRDFSQARAEAWLGLRADSGLDPEMAWTTEWRKPLDRLNDALRAQVDRISLSLNEREAVATTTAASAPQEERPESQEAFWTPAAKRENVETAIERLGLDAARAGMLRDLFAQFRHVVMTESLGGRIRSHALSASVPEPRAEHPDEMIDAAAKQRDLEDRWIGFRAEHEAQFREDVASMLDAQEQAVWFELCDSWRRRHRFALATERVQVRHVFNLFDLIQEVDPDLLERHAIAAEVDKYLRDADLILARIEGEFSVWSEKMSRITALHGWESQEFMDAWIARGADGRAIVSLNERTLQRLCDLVSDEEASTLVTAARRRLYPGIYLESPVERFATIVDDDPALLTRDQHARLKELLELHQSAQGHLRERLIAAVDRWNSTANLRTIRPRQADLQAQGKHPYTIFAEHPALPLFADDNAVVIQALRSLRAIFDAEEFVALPAHVRILIAWAD